MQDRVQQATLARKQEKGRVHPVFLGRSRCVPSLTVTSSEMCFTHYSLRCGRRRSPCSDRGSRRSAASETASSRLLGADCAANPRPALGRGQQPGELKRRDRGRKSGKCVLYVQEVAASPGPAEETTAQTTSNWHRGRCESGQSLPLQCATWWPF